MSGRAAGRALCRVGALLVVLLIPVATRVPHALGAPAHPVPTAGVEKLPAPEKLPGGGDLDDAYLETGRTYYGTLRRAYLHRAQVFEWQLLSSRIIFAMALAIVVSGMWMAVRQFEVGLRARPARPSPGGGTGTATEQRYVTTLSLSPRWGLKVSSRVLGVVILLISLALFYLYLLYVYPIHEVLTGG